MGYRVYLDVGSSSIPDAPRPPAPPLNGASFLSPLEGGSGASPLFVSGTGVGSLTLEGLLAARMHYVRVTAVDRAGNETGVSVAEERAKRTGTGGDGTLGAPRSLPLGTELGPLVVADFDRDGKDDIAVTNRGDARIEILYGNGDATFGTPVGVLLDAGEVPVDLAAADFSSDHTLDLLVLEESGPAVFQGLRDRADPFRVQASLGFGRIFAAMAVADYSGDFQPDVITAIAVVRDGSPAVVRENFLGFVRPGGFGADALELDRGNFEPPDLGGSARCLVVGDLRRDGRLGIVFRDEGSVGVQLRMLSSGRPAWTDTASYSSGAAPESLVLSDLNADAIPGIAVANRDGSIAILDGDGSGGFALPRRIQLGSAPGKLVLGDFDGDAIQDLAVAGSISGRSRFFWETVRRGAGTAPSVWGARFRSQALRRAWSLPIWTGTESWISWFRSSKDP